MGIRKQGGFCVRSYNFIKMSSGSEERDQNEDNIAITEAISGNKGDASEDDDLKKDKSGSNDAKDDEDAADKFIKLKVIAQDHSEVHFKVKKNNPITEGEPKLC